jgi:hypothetical protein
MTSMYKEKRYLICVSLILGVQIGYNVVHLRTSLVQLFLPPLHSWSNGWPCKILLVMFKCIVQHDVVVRTVYFDQPVDFYATTACFCFFELHGISETLTTHAQSSIWTHTQTLPLGASSKIEPTNPQNWRSHHRSLCCRRERLLPLKAQTSLNLENFTPRGQDWQKAGRSHRSCGGAGFCSSPQPKCSRVGVPEELFEPSRFRRPFGRAPCFVCGAEPVEILPNAPLSL